jgi:hypothetical protein
MLVMEQLMLITQLYWSGMLVVTCAGASQSTLISFRTGIAEVLGSIGSNNIIIGTDISLSNAF